jgi:hypothetical protein
MKPLGCILLVYLLFVSSVFLNLNNSETIGVDSLSEVMLEEHDPLVIKNVAVFAGDRDMAGRDKHVDQKAVDMVYEIVKGRKIKSYVGHSRFITDRTTMELGYFYNFRVDQEYLIADFRFFDFAAKHYEKNVDAILELAEVMPKEFAVSISMIAYHEWVFIDDEVIPYKKDSKIESKYLKHNDPVVRPLEVISFDWVDAGALTLDGIYRP